MHIPDGYLSPETCGAFTVAMVPAWATAGRKVRATVKSRYVPLLAIGAAYAFLVMMLNVPIPDGTTAHAVGAVLVAVVLGPWAAVIAVSIALAIQALFFGDGGVLAYGANTFNMALVMTMVGYYGVYRPLTRNVSLASPRRAFAAALGGYIGLAAAALCCGIELGVQPTLFHGANGAPLYAPYHLAQTLPAMLLAHLTVAGAVEFALTAGVVAYLQRANLPILRINHQGVPETDAELVGAPLRLKWWYALLPLAVMALATPLGLLYNAGAYGETDVKANPNGFLRANHLSALPAGLNHYARFWHHALFNGYDFGHDKHPAFGYVVSAVVGAAVISAVLLALFSAAGAIGAYRRRSPQRRTPQRRTPQRREAIEAPASRRATRSTPAWLVSSDVGMCPCGCIGTRTKGSFVEKTITGGAAVMRQAMFGEDVATGSGLLQPIDARVKLVTMLGVLVAVAVVRNTLTLVAVYALTLVVAAASHLRLAFFVKRVWLFIPIFTGIVILPATLNIVTHGHIVISLGSWWFGHRIGITSEGLQAAGLIVSRVAVSISIVVLLTLTTPWTKLMAGLRALLVPRMFVQVMGMAYRYIFSLLGSVEEMYTARRSRMVGTETDPKAGRAFVSASAGALFGKAHALSEEVHMAMVSRGYTGEVSSLESFRVGVAEYAWIAACTVAAATTIGLDRAFGR